MATGDDTRPDGRASTVETLRLRAATRALRLHLDNLPDDYNEAVPPDRFIAGMAFMSARNRYDCAESMIGAGFGGTIIGAVARSVFVDGLRWLWIGQNPTQRRKCLLGDLLSERNRIAKVLNDDNCAATTRWLMPVPPVADLTGASRTWLDAPTLPSEEQLLDQLLLGPAPSQPPSLGLPADPISDFIGRANQMLDMAGLRGAAMVLAQASHGSYLGQRSTLTEDGTPGFDVRADHEALFMQAAAVGVFATLVGTAAAVPDGWPHDVERDPFVEKAAVLAAEVSDAAVAIHRLAAKAKPGSQTAKIPAAGNVELLVGSAVIENDQVHADYQDIDERRAVLVNTFEHYIDVVRASPLITTLPSDGVPLHGLLAYGSALSNIQTVATIYDQPGTGAMAVFASRALLEEAARLSWRYSVQGEDALKARAKQYFDEHRFRERKTIRTLMGHGIKKADAFALFNKPSNVLVPSGGDDIAKNREPVPTVASMLRDFSAGSAQPGWLEPACGLLSQVVHATPLGLLHTLRFVGLEWEPNELSGEMFALTLDMAALGSAHSLAIMGLLLNDVSPAAQENIVKLKAAAYAVHLSARRIHGLGLGGPTEP